MNNVGHNVLIHEKVSPVLALGGVMMEGRLTISEELLSNIDVDTFWTEIAALKSKTLTITRINKKSITYREKDLASLFNEKCSPGDLAVECRLDFCTGKILKATKAKLLLCGDFFKAIFRSGMIEVNRGKIKLPEITLNGFFGILDILEKGELNPTIDAEEYAVASDMLQFTKATLEVYGKKFLEKYFGIIDDVSPLPKEAFMPSPLNKEKRMIDDFEFFWMPPTIDGVPVNVKSLAQIAKSDKFGKRKITLSCWYQIYEDVLINMPFEKGYWYAVSRVMAEEFRNIKCENTITQIKQNFPSLSVPTVREGILYCLTHHIKEETCLLSYVFDDEEFESVMGGRNDEGKSYTLCMELIKNSFNKESNVIVGHLAIEGGYLAVNGYDSINTSANVMLVQRFC